MEKQKSSRKERVIVHGLVNGFLVVLTLIITLMCGLFETEKAIETYKAYNGVIYAGNEKSNKVALMINVYWGTEFIEPILEILEKHEVKASFFVGKVWVENNEELFKKIVDGGHEIGNHGSNHKEHGKLSYQKNLEEIEGCSKVVERVSGIKMDLFAPPGGSYNKDTVKSAEALGYKTILWTKDTIDWRDQDSSLIYERATQNVSSGDLILMHPTRCTLEALEKIILEIKSKKLALDSVSNTIKD